MTSLRAAAVLVLPLVLGVAAVGAAAAEDGWRLLKRGGYVALVRHAYAPGSGDPASLTLGDCGTQRNLNDEGRRQAQRIGRLFKQKGVRVREIRTSQWCRCRETARLIATALKDVPVRDDAVLNSFFRDRSTEPNQTAALRRFIAALSRTGIVVLVTHQVNITALTGIYPASGEIVLVEAGQGLNFRPVARIGTR